VLPDALSAARLSDIVLCLDTVPNLIVSGCSDFQEAGEHQSQPKVIGRITRTRGGKEMNNYTNRRNESIYTL
jgi:hypothetical protein